MMLFSSVSRMPLLRFSYVVSSYLLSLSLSLSLSLTHTHEHKNRYPPQEHHYKYSAQQATTQINNVNINVVPQSIWQSSSRASQHHLNDFHPHNLYKQKSWRRYYASQSQQLQCPQSSVCTVEVQRIDVFIPPHFWLRRVF